jgi:phosphoribosylaminoimidazolecarboxamide formyltransferase/IMP cyclohydrolase
MARALLSVYDKTGLTDLARGLARLGFELVSTGGSCRHLERAGLAVTQVSDVTGFPEILSGRVKTLHPAIHGGILARREAEHLAELSAHGIAPVDVVAVNLYPFREAVADGVSFEGALEKIDIGGPAMLRAAAKNYPHVLAVVDPEDYPEVLEKLEQGTADEPFRRRLAAKAFAHTAAYDAAITRYLGGEFAGEQTALELTKLSDLRYGENPHQQASLWRLGSERGPVIDAEVLQGKAMSYNNYQDAEAAWELLRALSEPSAVAVKHANPCGVASAEDALRAFERARDADPVSIFGGIVAVNREVDEALAERLSEVFLEVVLAPAYTAGALARLAKKKNLRLLKVGEDGGAAKFDLRRVRGGLLVQDFDEATLDDAEPKVVSEREPTEAEWADLRFAWTVVKFVKSNAIVLAKDKVTVGIGAGQVSRIWATEQAITRAGERAAGAVLASDAFFPFADSVRAAAAAGVTAVIQPGGSVRDDEVIAAANELGLAMVATGMRHFRH